jgi:peptidoglycan/LPS O-acetylase OafA/YrhL
LGCSVRPLVFRNLQLDVLRGVAVLLVFGRHLEMEKPDGLIGGAAQLWFRIGWLGVDLFFVLSGFLIGGLLLSEYERRGRIDVGRFLVRRGLKIYPGYLVFLAYLICIPVLKSVWQGSDPAVTLSEQWQVYWPNLLFLQNYIGTNPAGHTWTLAVEEHFYLLLPWGLAALASMNRMRVITKICLAFALLCLVLRCVSVWTGNQLAVSMAATHLRLDALMFGVGLRAFAQFFPTQFVAVGNWRVLLLITGLIMWLPNIFIEPDTALIKTIGLTFTYLGLGAFLMAAYHTHAEQFPARLRRIVAPTASLLAWVGIYSYAIYLWHVTAIGILEREIGGRVLDLAGDPSGVVWAINAISVSVGAVFLGVAASKVVEWPVLRLRDRWFPSPTGTLPTEVAVTRSTVGSLPPHRTTIDAVRGEWRNSRFLKK